VLAAPAAPSSSVQGPQGEGPLGNDVFLPVAEASARELTAGDEALAKPGADAGASRAAAFEAWRRALAGADSGKSVPVLLPSDPDRGTESVDRAVVRRLLGAGGEVVSAWRARFDPIAQTAFDAAGYDVPSLERIERGFPVTRSGARAALALADQAFESGDPIGARTWLARARTSADALDRPLTAAIARRDAAAKADPSPADPAPSWTRGRRLRLEGRIPLVPSEAERTGPMRPGVEPGLAFLADGRVCVQGANRLHILGTDGRLQSLDARELVRAHGWNWLTPFAGAGERWPLRPACEGRRLALVEGRAAGTRGNALLLVEIGGEGVDPELVWGYSDAGFLAPDGKVGKLEDSIGPGVWQFEPGPLILAGTVYVQARQWIAEGEGPPSVDERAVRAWCLALDLRTGLPRWQRLLAVGASAKGRLQGARGFVRPAQELAVDGGRILAGTGIGAGAEIDLSDGRVRATWRFRRAPEGSRTWSSTAPRAGAAVVWAPPESDRLYFFQRGAEAAVGSPFALPAREIGGDLAPLAAAGDRILLLSRNGGAVTLAWIAPASGARVDSVELPTGERFAPDALASPTRALLASDRRAFLFDLERGIYLCDSVRLPGREESPEGQVAARGDRVYVAGERSLWILQVR